MLCPRCDGIQLHDGRCRGCNGAWLDETHVRAQASADLEITNPERSKLPCPSCGELMTAVLVFDVPIDCCDHGMWFDADELEEVLRRSRSDGWRIYGGVNRARPSLIEMILKLLRK